VTDDPGDAGLEWPAEEFRFATCVGWGGEVGRGDQDQDQGLCGGSVLGCGGEGEGEVWSWVADIDGVWRDPGQMIMG